MQTTTQPKTRKIIFPLEQRNNAEMKKQRNIDELEVENFIPINKFDAKGVYMLSHEEEDGIKEALEQVEKGELISNEDLMLEVASYCT